MAGRVVVPVRVRGEVSTKPIVQDGSVQDEKPRPFKNIFNNMELN